MVGGYSCLPYSQERERTRARLGDKVSPLKDTCPNDLLPPSKPRLLVASSAMDSSMDLPHDEVSATCPVISTVPPAGDTAIINTGAFGASNEDGICVPLFLFNFWNSELLSLCPKRCYWAMAKISKPPIILSVKRRLSSPIHVDR